MDDSFDGPLFRFWCRVASDRPGMTAARLVHCTTPDEYRTALEKLARDLGVNLPWATPTEVREEERS